VRGVRREHGGEFSTGGGWESTSVWGVFRFVEGGDGGERRRRRRRARGGAAPRRTRTTRRRTRRRIRGRTRFRWVSPVRCAGWGTDRHGGSENDGGVRCGSGRGDDGAVRRGRGARDASVVDARRRGGGRGTRRGYLGDSVYFLPAWELSRGRCVQVFARGRGRRGRRRRRRRRDVVVRASTRRESRFAGGTDK